MVERYLPGLSPETVAAAVVRAEEATLAVAAKGIELRYLGCTLVPAEEAIFCLFESPSQSIIEEVNRQAAFPLYRIVEAVRVR